MTPNHSCEQPRTNRLNRVLVLVYSILLIYLSITPSQVLGQKQETGFLNRSLVKDGIEKAYQVYVPRQFDNNSSWPLIVYLHGMGPGGNDGITHTAGGLAEVIRIFPKWFPAVALFPQAPADSNWVGRAAELVVEQIDATISEFGLDARRVYLSGASMGGEGVYYVALRNPNLFAALIVSCGSPFTPAWRLDQLGLTEIDRSEKAFLSVAQSLRNIPLWVFHGSDDTIVEIAEARAMVEALGAIGSPPKFTEYPGLGHDACGRGFYEEELWQWLFLQEVSDHRKGGF